MIWKIWKDTNKIYAIDANSYDSALAAVRKFEPNANSGQACEDLEVTILCEALNGLSLDRVRIVPKSILYSNYICRKGK